MSTNGHIINLNKEKNVLSWAIILPIFQTTAIWFNKKVVTLQLIFYKKTTLFV